MLADTMAIWRLLFCSVKGPKRLGGIRRERKVHFQLAGILVLRFSVALRRSRPVTTGARLSNVPDFAADPARRGVRLSLRPGDHFGARRQNAAVRGQARQTCEVIVLWDLRRI